MTATTALYMLAIFRYNQLGDNDPALNQGVDVLKESKHARTWIVFRTGIVQSNGSTTHNAIAITTFKKTCQTSRSHSSQSGSNRLSILLTANSDGHHSWQNYCDAVFTTQHALPIAALKDDSCSNHIYLAPDLPVHAAEQGIEDFYVQNCIDVEALADAKVTNIAGQSACNCLNNVGVPTASTYQDPDQRLNYLLASYTADGNGGAFGRAPGHFVNTRSLDSNNITLGVKTQDGGSDHPLVHCVPS